MTVAISPHYPWYFVWLALPCCVCARWSIIWLSIAPVLLYINPWNERFFWPCLVYLPAAALAVREWWRPAVPQSLDAVKAAQGGFVMSATVLPDPRRYFEAVAAQREQTAEADPVCLYLEVTNRCNLLCETCPRTFEELEPPADMSWALFTRIVDQYPNIARVVLHGVGEPMLVKDLPRMIRYLKDRGTYVLFNTNGTLLQPKKFPGLIDCGLDELRVSLDAADRATYLKVRGKDFFQRIVRDVGKIHRLPARGRRHRAARLAVADRAEGNGGATARLRPPGRADGRAGGASAAPGVRRSAGTAWRARNPRCSSRRAPRSRRRSRRRRLSARSLA